MSNASTRWHPPQPQPSASAAAAGGVKRSGLKLYNSLSDSLVDFTPEDPHRCDDALPTEPFLCSASWPTAAAGSRSTSAGQPSTTVRTWYALQFIHWCIVTLYQGHARTYLSFDLLRRVMENYFGYNIFMVQPADPFPFSSLAACLSSCDLIISYLVQVMNITDVDDKIILKARRNHLLAKFFASPPPPSDVLDRVRHGILSATTKLQVAPRLLESAIFSLTPLGRASWRS